MPDISKTELMLIYLMQIIDVSLSASL